MRCSAKHEEKHINCGHSVREVIEGRNVCSHCGFVFDVVPESIEWWSGTDDVRQRASSISDTLGTNGSTVGDKRLVHLQKGLTGGNKQRVFTEGRDFIMNVCSDLCVGEAVETEALHIFSIVREQHGHWRGSKRMGTLIACVSIACQKFSIGMTDATILKLQRVNQPSKVMNMQKKHVLTALHKSGVIIDRANAETYCYRVCSDLGFNRELLKLVSTQAKRISKMEHLNARSCNMIVAVSILFLIEKYNLSIQISKLCRIVSVTRPTLVKWYAEAAVRSLSCTRSIIQSLDSSIS